ncbi:MAG: hypothetical protein A2700_01395 [Candidatus Blackburnbacteria bacterium RIFCSPHIGHO2_01_FULL_44_64]|uniref:Uncharacterized protein n=1 Tax=Candidatus Blackburnbacteria bacterium RIFCSPHIGHO2_02_FULL_44_20 TaxID=1797516 RepID=A0A1G1V4M1_9BACT|nr:MAG: hypothetical protein A2700_01395 [Candidatus Blackburnbacteria bacterium RIFCSPHIGHO2_01_FULL_44_64]OGY10329.1 MAG: hypothetical protein A3D26_03450 [Candidatus Blackburnbacteria bacterium RIFCSPHIGHO2_02_FULL_44_20]OGY11973.1 MAG: hypothetical protein A3E16_02090 [Candidatus Blackburnbacteria bacterium RIFCSPHIGHO2_12_FULL_44_25]
MVHSSQMRRVMYQLLALGVLVAGALLVAQVSPQVKTSDYKSIPEMKDILSDDQTTRLKATRKLAERVGVEESLEILEHSSLPHTGEGHLAVHQIGFYAYQTHGLDSILHCRDYFLFACYHGAIIEAATDQGFEAVAQMTDKCKQFSTRYFQCVHAAGHAILAIWGYQNLTDALKTCDDLYAKETQFPEAVSSCHNGAFMENLFGVHDWETGREAERTWLSEDPYFPCNGVDDKYQKGCWLNQAARIYQMNKGDISKTAELCQKVGDPQHTTWCMDNLARQIHPLTAGDITRSFSLCGLVGDAWREHCIVVNAGAYYSVGGREEAIAICRRVVPETKEKCYQTILGQILSDTVDPQEKGVLCQKLEYPYVNACMSQLYSTAQN